MNRLMACDRDGSNRRDIWPTLTSPATRREVVNGEHTLTLETTERLGEGTRLLNVDATGKVREWVVDEPDETHDLTGGMTYSYVATWSMQYDLTGAAGDVAWASGQEGTHTSTSARSALGAALSSQSMWEVGNVTVTKVGAASLYDGQVWDYLKKLLDVWGGEMEPRIVVNARGEVTHRYVDWLARVGSDDVTRRFDFGWDCDRIRRTPAPGPRYSRVKPRGGQAKTDDDGVDYSDRVGIENLTAEDVLATDGWTLRSGTTYENGDLRFTIGTDYIEDAAAAADFGASELTTKVVTYDVEQTGSGPDDAELFAKATAEVFDHTRPRVTYEAHVTQLADAGMDVRGVALGDTVHVVDRKFGPAPLRLEARVTETEVNLLDPSDVTLTIGDLRETMAQSFAELRESVTAAIETVTGGGTLVYLEGLLDAINRELNTTGGWKYEVEGYGTYIYDVQVSDPRIGKEAHRAIHLGGGFIRFANTKNSDYSWNWTNVINGDGYLGLAATIARIKTGFIGDSSKGSWWDLDNGVLHISNRTDRQIIDDITGAAKTATDYMTYENGQLIIGATDSAVRNVMTNTRSAFRQGSEDIAYFGLGDDSMWRMYIENAQITDMLRFGDFAWIARANGNMTLKWIGSE